MSVVNHPSYLSKQHIEREAETLLERMRRNPQYTPSFPLDPQRVADFLDLNVVWVTIQPDNNGEIAARILPLIREIEINDNIPALRGGFGNSTLAHEIGHWILHINHGEVDGSSKQQTLDLGLNESPPFLCRSTGYQQGIEWQAQYFASCLLMPSYVLKDVLQGRTLTKWNHLFAMADELGVTISNLTNRLQGLGWITLDKDSKQIYLGKQTPTGQGNVLDIS